MKLFAERRRFFPNPRITMFDGVVAMGEQMDVEHLLEAYSFGIFPWPQEDLPVLWFCPEQRGVLDFEELHVSRSLKKFVAENPYHITVNTAFQQVIHECAKAPRKGQDGTWITDLVVNSYTQFHQKGYAHSIECWLDDELIGGLYGVYVGGVFSGESMFHKRTNASKLCLLKTIDLLRAQGKSWIDIQMVTPLLEQMGGKYIARDEFLQRLEREKQKAQPLNWG